MVDNIGISIYVIYKNIFYGAHHYIFMYKNIENIRIYI